MILQSFVSQMQSALCTQFELGESVAYLPVMAVLIYSGGGRREYRIIGTDVVVPLVIDNSLHSGTDGWFVHRRRLYQIRTEQSGTSYRVFLVYRDSDGVVCSTSMSARCLFKKDNGSCCVIANSNIRPTLCDDHYAYPVEIEGQLRIVRIYIDREQIIIGEPFTPDGYWTSSIYTAWDSAHSRLHLFAVCSEGRLVDISDPKRVLRMQIVNNASNIDIIVYDNIAYVSSSRYSVNMMCRAYNIISGETVPYNLPRNVRPSGGSLVNTIHNVHDMHEIIEIDLRTGDEYMIEKVRSFAAEWYTPWTIMSAAL